MITLIKFFKSLFLLSRNNSYVNLKSSTSGANFYRLISSYINSISLKNKYILLNIDAPIYIVVLCKLFRRKIAIRADGLYSDNYIFSNYKQIIRWKKISYLLLQLFFNKGRAFFISNNIPEIFKLYFSDALIFQSNFVRNQILYHLSFCKAKSSKIILNAKNIDIPINKEITRSNSELKILTLFDPVRARKRTDLMLVVLAGISKYIDIPFQVNMHGFYSLQDYPSWFLNEAIDILLSPPAWLNLYSKYDNSDNSKVFKEFLKNDVTFSLSIFDPCPNFIIESLCLGLPVIAPESGGIPEIVGKGGLLIKESFCNKDQYFFDDLYRTENLSGDEISKLIGLYSEAIINVKFNLSGFKSKARDQYKEKLNMNKSFNSYKEYLTSL